MNLKDKRELLTQAEHVNATWTAFNDALAAYLIASNKDCSALHAIEDIYESHIQPNIRDARISVDMHQALVQTVVDIHKVNRGVYA